MRSDRGGEFYGRHGETGQLMGPFAKYLEDCGIVSQFTMPGTPEQNGVAKRRNRTLMVSSPLVANGCSKLRRTPMAMWRGTKQNWCLKALLRERELTIMRPSLLFPLKIPLGSLWLWWHIMIWSYIRWM